MPFIIHAYNGKYDVAMMSHKPEELTDAALSEAFRRETSKELCDALWKVVKGIIREQIDNKAKT